MGSRSRGMEVVMPEPTPAALKHRFRIDLIPNPWFSLGVHFDHRQWMLQLHLPGVVVRVGWRNRETVTSRCPCGRKDSWAWRWKYPQETQPGEPNG